MFNPPRCFVRDPIARLAPRALSSVSQCRVRPALFAGIAGQPVHFIARSPWADLVGQF